MKAEFDVTQYASAAVILLLFAILIFANLFTAEKVQASGYTPPVEKVECRTNSDCNQNNNGHLCMSIDSSSGFCGCLTDGFPDCTGGRRCVFNKCQ